MGVLGREGKYIYSLTPQVKSYLQDLNLGPLGHAAVTLSLCPSSLSSESSLYHLLEIF